MNVIQHMLETQADLQRDAYGVNHAFMREPSDARATYIRDNVLALTDELHEALGEVGWKPWATSRHLNEDAYVAELVDAWHFMMNLLLATGIPPEELARKFIMKYFEKVERNAARQVRGYDGVTDKCPGCHRALDDVAVACARADRTDGMFIVCAADGEWRKISATRP